MNYTSRISDRNFIALLEEASPVSNFNDLQRAVVMESTVTSRKKVREVIGYTHKRQESNAVAWFNAAMSFHQAANVLYASQDRVESGFRIFAFNAAVSIELILKAILARRNSSVPDPHHRLRELSEAANVGLTADQKDTLGLMTEIIIWAGRYPTPKTEKQWDEYHDNIFEKHTIRSVSGKTYTTRAHPEKFPSWENYNKIWLICVAAYEAMIP